MLSLYPWDLLAEDAQVLPQASGFRGVTLAYNVKNEQEVIALLERAGDAGAKIVKPGQKAHWGGFLGILRI